VLPAEHGDRSGLEPEVACLVRGETEPAGREDAKDVPMGERQHIAACEPPIASQPRDQGVSSRTHAGNRLAAGTAIGEEIPPGSKLADLSGRQPLVVAIVHLEEEIGRLDGLTEACKPARLEGAPQRARDHEGRLQAAEALLQSPCIGLAVRQQRQVRTTSVASDSAPFRGRVPHDHDPARRRLGPGLRRL
jgi:hypothetical protein